MHFVYAVTKPEAFLPVFESGQSLIANINRYLTWLQTLGPVNKPHGIVFHDLESATSVFSDHVLPAWTNGRLIHLDPLVEDWKQIFLSALTESLPVEAAQLVSVYYESLDTFDVATIAAHELTHHVACFEHTPIEAMWFEEGFCFYVPRKQLLAPTRLLQLQHVERVLIDVHKEQLGRHPIWQFGLSDSGASFTDALFDYWRAIQVVSQLIDKYARGNTTGILELFIAWNEQAPKTNRFDEFLIERLGISQADQQVLWLV